MGRSAYWRILTELCGVVGQRSNINQLPVVLSRIGDLDLSIYHTCAANGGYGGPHRSTLLTATKGRERE